MTEVAFIQVPAAAKLNYRHSPTRSLSDFPSHHQLKSSWKIEERSLSPSSSRSSSPSSKDGDTSDNKDDTSSASSSISTFSTDSKDLTKDPKIFNKIKGYQRPKSVKIDTPLVVTTALDKQPKRPFSMAFLARTVVSESSVMTMSSSASAASTTSLATNSSAATQRRPVKDDLWYAFRGLETDYAKFTSNTSAEKGSIVRMCLLPFLRKFERKSTSSTSSMEELDRRIRILNRWWTSLLANLRNQNDQAVNSSDRSSYYEAINGIMTRPEWTSSPSSLTPYSRRNPDTSSSFSSLSSASSNYSMERSVQHNMRSFFTSSLSDTLIFVVEALAVRQPHNMIEFAGNVLAYAFFFCNEIAETLVGLWRIQPAHLRRVLNEYGLGRGTDLRAVAEDVIQEFPLCMQSLGFTTLSAAILRLRRPSRPGIGVPVNWYSSWLQRWSGRDTDLLFVFAKQYHILLAEYLPAGTSATARLCAPGFIYLQAQLLSHLDCVIHPSQTLPLNGFAGSSLSFMNQSVDANAGSITFDDVLADTQVHSHRQQPKSHWDQRIFVLAKDICQDRHMNPIAKQAFGETLSSLLRSAVKQIMVMDHVACVLICDILEEAIPVLQVLERSSLGSNFVDWAFWTDVCKRILQNQNSMSELRLFSFVYVSWEYLTEDEDRRRYLCLDWLLNEDIWNRFFGHWCPMVRAFYMRLICWRVARCAGEPSQIDTEILEILLLRLRNAYARHNLMKSQADKAQLPGPSIAPCPPAPGRKLSIIRSHNSNQSSGKYSSWEALMPVVIKQTASVSVSEKVEKASQPLKSATETLGKQQTSEPEPKINNENLNYIGTPTISPSKKKWSSLFRNLLGMPSENVKPEIINTPRPRAPKMLQTISNNKPLTITTGRRMHFKFVLEQSDRAAHPPRPRPISTPRLPALSQEHLELVLENLPEADLLLKHSEDSTTTWKYISRALAEWTLVVDECDNFIERRKIDGAYDPRSIDIPTLTVEALRK